MCVDDNMLVAQAVERRLSREPGFEWAGWVAATGDLLSRVEQAQPNVILLDIDMPGRETFELAKEIFERYPQSRVIMFSGYVRADYIDRAVECGAWGYASKNECIDELLSAIRQVAAGSFAMTSDALAEHHRAVQRSHGNGQG